MHLNLRTTFGLLIENGLLTGYFTKILRSVDKNLVTTKKKEKLFEKVFKKCLLYFIY